MYCVQLYTGIYVPYRISILLFFISLNTEVLCTFTYRYMNKYTYTLDFVLKYHYNPLLYYINFMTMLFHINSFYCIKMPNCESNNNSKHWVNSIALSYQKNTAFLRAFAISIYCKLTHTCHNHRLRLLSGDQR